MSGRPWTEEEEAALLANCAEHEWSWDGWRQLIPGRTENAVRRHASVLGAGRKERQKWSQAEDAALRREFPAHGSRWDGWSELLPRRTRGAIRRRAYFTLHVHADIGAVKRAAATDELRRCIAEGTRDEAEIVRRCAKAAHTGEDAMRWMLTDILREEIANRKNTTRKELA